MKLKLLAMIAVLGLAFFYLAQTEKVDAAGGALPPWPVIYTGDVTLGGEPVPDGMWVFATMDGYTSTPVEVRNGRIAGLAAGGPDTSYFNKVISFELSKTEIYNAGTTVVAEETDVFVKYPSPFLRSEFSLTFGAFPTPTPLPTATPTATPVPTATPLATATPISVGPVVYNGLVVVSGGGVPDGATLNARVGGYESAAVDVKSDGAYISLIIDLDDPAMTDKEVTFYLNGVLSRTTALYNVGPTIRNVDLIFMEIAGATPLLPTAPPPPPPPAPTQRPTETPVPVQPTALPAVVPIAAPAAPLETPTPVVLVVTATPETVVVANEPQEPKEESGGCMAVKDVSPLTGTANVLAMIGPLLLLVGYRGVRKIL